MPSISDIVGLLETHIYDEVLEKLNIAGFSRLKYKNRKKFKNINKTSGGIALFAKTRLANILQPFNTTNKDIIWIKLNKKYHDSPKDIF